MNLKHVFDQGDPVLVAVFLLLLAMSVISWYIIFLKSWKLSTERKSLKNFRALYVTTPDWPRHASLIAAPGCISLLIKETEKLTPVLSSYAPSERKDILSMHLVQALDNARTQLDKGLTILASVGSSSPFIGLFGTVWGIYGALMQISAAGNAGLSVVAGPMGEALVATAIGLFAAIPAVLAYNSFVRLNRLVVQDLRHIAEQLTTYLSLEGVAKKDTKIMQGAR